jgi:predicted adenine nucleotide alpha hydrolase (AANH) superfamily ATPase
MPENVRFARGGIDYIKSKSNVILSNDDVARIVAQIESGRLERGFQTNRQHVKHVKEIVKQKSEIKSCSKCNAEMVLRTATKGKNAGHEFWGCSAFPKCRNVIGIG